MAIQITYNSVNITLEVGPDGLRTRHVQERNENRAGTGKIKTINHYGILEGTFDAIFSDAVYYTLWGWWSWARQGKSWAFAMDSNDIANTTLDGAAAAAQKTIPLTATTSLSAGDYCLIRAEDNDDEFEVVCIDTISAGVSVDAVSNLVFGYSSGDTFRHLDYFPSVVSIDAAFEPQKQGNYWTNEFRFIEAL
jgi:hypothetical protein